MRIGVGIISFDRPYYLRRLLNSLEKQTDLSEIDFHLFQDGAVNRYTGRVYAQLPVIKQSIKTFKNAKLPNKTEHLREYNVNVGINSQEAWDTMTAAYDWVMMIEDDLILSPHWFKLARGLYPQLEERKDVFSFSPGFIRTCDQADISQNLNKVIAPLTHHFWCECFTPERWQRIRPLYMDFYNSFIAERDFHKRDSALIKAWHVQQGYPTVVTTQDAGWQTSVLVNGMVRVQCAVNRGMSIGMDGLHFNQRIYNAFHLAEQLPYSFAEDATRDGFEWV